MVILGSGVSEKRSPMHYFKQEQMNNSIAICYWHVINSQTLDMGVVTIYTIIYLLLSIYYLLLLIKEPTRISLNPPRKTYTDKSKPHYQSHLMQSNSLH
jgi:hypothetical protein